jgi:hypothetical protein
MPIGKDSYWALKNSSDSNPPETPRLFEELNELRMSLLRVSDEELRQMLAQHSAKLSVN